MMKFANIEWRNIDNNSQPYSIDFNDVYFNSESGLAETEYIFIAQNQLIQRFKNLSSPCFTIIETGFGTGLNFLCAAAYFLALAPANANLKYISIEKYPLKCEDMQKAMQLFLGMRPQFAEIASKFLLKYVNLNESLNEMNIAENRTQLDLWLGDIVNVLPQITEKSDAWFLDGFSPAKNADMWGNEVFKHMARLSKPEATFATFTSAGAVRRGLQAAGFEVKKQAGYGKKREMLFGSFLEYSNKENI